MTSLLTYFQAWIIKLLSVDITERTSTPTNLNLVRYNEMHRISASGGTRDPLNVFPITLSEPTLKQNKRFKAKYTSLVNRQG